MTLLHVKNLLLSHFLNNDTFSVVNDLALINLKDDDNEELAPFGAQLVREALKDFATQGIVRLIDPATELFIIAQPIASYPQQVTISPMCAEMLADSINAFAKGAGIKGVICNKLALQEQDIMSLIQFFHIVLESDDEGPDKAAERKTA